MRLRVLGCSGGIGAQARTTSFLVDDDLLLDAGTGLDDLDIDALARIEHVFITHSHLDHVAGLPLLVDSVGALRERPLRVHALPETIAALRTHIFNWVIWPDFTEIPHFERPWLQFQPVDTHGVVDLGDGRRVRALPAVHTVPAVGWLVSDARGTALAFTGDTGPNEALWRALASLPALHGLIIETAFAEHDIGMARLAKHLSPGLLQQELSRLQGDPALFITHLKPADRARIERELAERLAGRRVHILRRGEQHLLGG